MQESAIDIDSINDAQREAVLTCEGPLLVLAGAGSGKTRLLTHRIAHMVADLGVAPWQVLAITVTNKAAAAMRERLGALLPGAPRGWPRAPAPSGWGATTTSPSTPGAAPTSRPSGTASRTTPPPAW